MTVDDLAQEIRRVDGDNPLGAGALAEAIMAFLDRSPPPHTISGERVSEERLAILADMRKHYDTGRMDMWAGEFVKSREVASMAAELLALRAPASAGAVAVKPHDLESQMFNALIHDYPAPYVRVDRLAKKLAAVARAAITHPLPTDEAPKGWKWEMVPDYPEGDVVGACICGSWPGGKCLRCPTVPARSTP